MMPKICSQGYRFSVAVCKSGEQRGFIFLTHHTKTMSCRIAASNREDPPVLRSSGFALNTARLMLQVRSH